MASSERPSELRVAVAVGGATTDAVAIDARDRLLARAEVDTTDDLASVLGSVMRQVIAAPGVDRALVKRVMLATGQTLTRALQDLAVEHVAVIRIGSPLTGAVPPLAAWPHALRDAVSAGEIVVGGGVEYDGRVAGALDEDEIARFLGMLDRDLDAVAITGVFSPVAPEHELAAAAVVRRELGAGVNLSLSHELGTLGLIERENGAVLNAALAGAAQRIAAVLEGVLRTEGIAAEPFLSRSDGALMALQFAVRLPVLMLDSGPANSMRGAVHLTGVGDAVVVNADGTVIEVGTVVHGLPREAASLAEIAGIRTGFRVPDVRRLPWDADGGALAEAVDAAGADLRAPPVLAVGRASGVALDRLPGIARVLRPPAGEVAAAVGAAIGEVTGRADRIAADRPDRRQEALEAAREAAIALAVHAGADPDGLHVVGVDETPLTYDVEPVVRIGVKVAGPPI
jgi:N-methylhydantoinase A/oxoprolinase/acetone carboxylase beta subunit